MNNKDLRKELELSLEKSITETLVKRNAEVAKKIQKNAHEASKKIAKKFFKTMKELSEKKSTPAKKKTSPVAKKTAPKNAVKSKSPETKVKDVKNAKTKSRKNK